MEQRRFTSIGMPMLVAGLLLLWLSSILLRGFMRGDPARMAKLLQKTGGVVALLLAALMILRGEFNVALLAALAGLWLLGSRATVLGTRFGQGFAGRRRAEPSGPVRIRTDGLDVVLDRSTGEMRGGFAAGPVAGRDLADLSETECAAGYRWCLDHDARGAALLEVYFDRRFARWREAGQFGYDPGGAEARNRARRPVSMPDHEAYHVLGLAEGASREEITRAHRRLMKQYHPDHGGSTAMAARVNEAKDVLMHRHP